MKTFFDLKFFKFSEAMVNLENWNFPSASLSTISYRTNILTNTIKTGDSGICK